MHPDLVTVVPHFLHLLVVRVLMRYIESRLDVAAVRVLPVWREQLLCVELPVLCIDGIIERKDYHLGHLIRIHPSRNQSPVFRAETVWKRASHRVTRFGSIRIIVHITPALVWTVWTVNRSIAEVLIRQTSTIATAQMICLSAPGVLEQGLWDTSLCFFKWEQVNLTFKCIYSNKFLQFK